jgi:LEM3 (ligand-effect modulator 3) family / CDC50 family
MAGQDKKPKNTSLKQQRLWAFRPVHSVESSLIILSVCGLIFITLGITFYVGYSNQTEYSVRYNDSCTGSACIQYIQVPTTIPGPVFVYYELENFYQNYRLYVKSKSYTQLRGGNPPSSELSYCNGARYNKDFAGYYTGKTLNPDDTARPCGLIARSVFNDTFRIPGYTIDTSKIVTSVDKSMYEDIPSNEWRTIDEHLITWMKISPLPNFRKLWGVIYSDVNAGKLEIDISNNYDVSGWNGTKNIILSTNGMLGGKNIFLWIFFICAGAFCFLCCLFFIFGIICCKSKWTEQDPSLWRF